jgi:hypothetical protein
MANSVQAHGVPNLHACALRDRDRNESPARDVGPGEIETAGQNRRENYACETWSPHAPNVAATACALHPLWYVEVVGHYVVSLTPR